MDESDKTSLIPVNLLIGCDSVVFIFACKMSTLSSSFRYINLGLFRGNQVYLVLGKQSVKVRKVAFLKQICENI